MNYIINDSGITAIIDGEQYTVASDNPVYGQVRSAIQNREDEDTIAQLFRTANAVKRYFRGDIEVRDGVLFYQGEEVNGYVVDKILGFMADRLPVEPLIAFLKNLLANPSKRSIEELYKFLEHKNMPITDDGCFLGYKGVNDNYTDVHSGKFFNGVGTVNEMPRNKVCDDFRQGCSYGFHVGSLEYATSWGTRTVIVKVNPKDVVSVPECSNWQKLRTARYEVIADYNGPLPQNYTKDTDPYGDVETFAPETSSYDDGYMDGYLAAEQDAGY